MTLLTLHDAGQLSASFVETETPQACEQKVTRIAGIFKVAGIAIVRSHCGMSDYRFSKYVHSHTSQEKPFSYQIDIDDSGAEVTAMALGQCQSELREKTEVSGEEQKIFCVTSSQSLI